MVCGLVVAPSKCNLYKLKKQRWSKDQTDTTFSVQQHVFLRPGYKRFTQSTPERKKLLYARVVDTRCFTAEVGGKIQDKTWRTRRMNNNFAKCLPLQWRGKGAQYWANVYKPFNPSTIFHLGGSAADKVLGTMLVADALPITTMVWNEAHKKFINAVVDAQLIRLMTVDKNRYETKELAATVKAHVGTLLNEAERDDDGNSGSSSDGDNN